MRILITGGLGFIGGRLGKYLSEQGFEVTLGSRKNLKPPDWLHDAKMVRTFWENESALKKICSKVDVIIHAAGMNAKDCLENPKLALEFNGAATARLVSAAINSRIKLFLYLSTTHVYSNKLLGYIDENTPTINNHPYATSHLAGERAVLNFTNSSSMQSIVLRISNTFGYPTHFKTDCWSLLVNDLCKQVVVSDKIQLNSSGHDMRNFITMTDLCRVINFLILSSNNTDQPKIINIGSNESNSVYDMALLVQNECLKVLGYTPKIEINNKSVGHQNQKLEFKSLYRSLYEESQVNDQKGEINKLLDKCKFWFTKTNV